MVTFTRLLIAGIVMLLSACATPLTKGELEQIKRVGIVNNFPEHPSFTSIGTTLFNNTYDRAKDPTLKPFVTEHLATRLQERGFTVTEIDSENTDAGVDMVVIVIPRDIYNMVDTFGYGFYQRSMFGANAFRKSYTALNLEPRIKGKSRCSACYGESLTDLPIDDMPEEWSSLSETQQQQFAESLRTDIRNAIDRALQKTGL